MKTISARGAPSAIGLEEVGAQRRVDDVEEAADDAVLVEAVDRPASAVSISAAAVAAAPLVGRVRVEARAEHLDQRRATAAWRLSVAHM